MDKLLLECIIFFDVTAWLFGSGRRLLINSLLRAFNVSQCDIVFSLENVIKIVLGQLLWYPYLNLVKAAIDREAHNRK